MAQEDSETIKIKKNIIRDLIDVCHVHEKMLPMGGIERVSFMISTMVNLLPNYLKHTFLAASHPIGGEVAKEDAKKLCQKILEQTIKETQDVMPKYLASFDEWCGDPECKNCKDIKHD
jgi:hypothetical protein